MTSPVALPSMRVSVSTRYEDITPPMTPIYDSPQAGTFIPVFAFALDEGWCPYAAEYRKWTKVSPAESHYANDDTVPLFARPAPRPKVVISTPPGHVSAQLSCAQDTPLEPPSSCHVDNVPLFALPAPKARVVIRAPPGHVSDQVICDQAAPLPSPSKCVIEEIPLVSLPVPKAKVSLRAPPCAISDPRVKIIWGETTAQDRADTAWNGLDGRMIAQRAARLGIWISSTSAQGWPLTGLPF
ncbi:uncharacterized protein MKK02DRAFT_41132 [Dioszegia hungarica]|uniref:Uncharacterized protein n=1 Tax=Dioszegia hungarica TaxID=4972 RepID=A0AA38LRC8_9TREE|nr:uncharacterized protein MKK02DRAFT_41132 [Dioszegia hungarica]KAI9632820.1 hypothetical protein MKK02DRAFT_41132 [Dioszegia hungarica]